MIFEAREAMLSQASQRHPPQRQMRERLRFMGLDDDVNRSLLQLLDTDANDILDVRRGGRGGAGHGGREGGVGRGWGVIVVHWRKGRSHQCLQCQRCQAVQEMLEVTSFREPPQSFCTQ